MDTDKYVFFYGGILSQWFPANITDSGTTYHCNEQYMMAMKAILFGDLESYKLIMESDDPSICKQIGRKVKGFDEDIWNEAKYNIVYRCNKLKFTQNLNLQEELLKFNCDLFVEASPTDRIWGIGLSVNRAKRTPKSKWRGQNLLGKIITRVRNEIQLGDI